jgi:hypothetical protein
MSLYNQNPFMFYFSIIAITAMVLYFGYVAIDRVGLRTEKETATVITKQHYRGGEAPVVNIGAGRPWVQSQLQPNMYLLSLKSNNEELGACVSQATFDSVNPGDTVNIVKQRRRLSGIYIIKEVTRK